MTCEEFKKSINLRSIEKCCATCDSSYHDDDGGYECHLPQVEEVTDGFGDVYKIAYIMVEANSVCDRWQERRQC